MSFVPLIDRDGTPFSNFIVGSSYAETAAEVIRALGGNDYILGDSGHILAPFSGADSFATAVDIDDPLLWTVDENPMFGNGAIPHTTLYLEGEPGGTIYVSVSVAAGQTITVDIDFGDHPIGTIEFPGVSLYDSGQNLVTEHANPAQPDVGSASRQDPVLTFTAPAAGTYFIHFFSRDVDGRFGGGETFLANISVGGHATTAPTAMDADTLSGGAGDDFVMGQGGGDALFGDDGDDALFGGAGGDSLSGGLGADILAGGADADMLNGGSGIDTADYSASPGAVVINLDTGLGVFGDADGDSLAAIEKVVGSRFEDALGGGDGNDILDGGDGNDVLNGAGGNDRLLNGLGSDTMTGGGGFDIADYSRNPFAIMVDLEAGTATEGFGDGDMLDGIEAVIGTAGNDVLRGTSGNDRLIGNLGADTLDGRGGDDFLEAGGLFGGSMVDGGAGFDTVSYARASTGITVDLAAGEVEEQNGPIGRVTGIELFIASEHSDTVRGFNLADQVDGGGGDDRVTGMDGDDRLWGNEGDDALDGGAGADRLAGDDGDDTLSAGSGDDALLGGAGFDALSGGSGQDDLDGGSGGDLLVGGSGNDVYRIDGIGDQVQELAGNGFDRLISRVSYTLADSLHIEGLSARSASTTPIDLVGNSIDNRITGNNGANVLRGEEGADFLSGLGGGDRLYGGTGRDVMTGGAGRDHYHFDTAIGPASLADRINGFAAADDTILLDRAVFGAIARTGTISGSAFRVGTAAAEADDRIIYHRATGRIFYDADGNGAGAQLLFATVGPGTGLTRLDFVAYDSSAAAAREAAFAAPARVENSFLEPGRLSGTEPLPALELQLV